MTTRWRDATRALLAMLALLFVAGAIGCAKPNAKSVEAGRTVATAPKTWIDALVDERRDFVLAISPRDLMRDPVFGALVRRAIDLALEHVRTRGASASTLEAVLRAEDLLIAARDRDGRDVVVVLAGVPSDLDPSALADDVGRPVFTRVSGTGRIRTFAGAAPERRLRLFELPGGTWVLGIGAGAERCEAAFAGAGSLAYSPRLHLPAEARFVGDLLSSLKERAGRGLRPVTQGLDAGTLTLAHDPTKPSRARVRLELSYRDEPHAAEAEPTAARAAELLPTRLDWPVAPRVTRNGTVVAIEVAFESQLPVQPP